MQLDRRQQRYLVSGALFFIGYLIYSIFGRTIGQFISGSVRVWWQSGGPGHIFGAFVGLAAFLLFQTLAFDTDWKNLFARLNSRVRHNKHST